MAARRGHQDCRAYDKMNSWIDRIEREVVLNKSSRYARIFSPSSLNFQTGKGLNLLLIASNLQYANDKLKFNGYLFLNEVYELFGMPRTAIGAIVGWFYNPDNSDGDNFVDFTYEVLNNGHILIDFNVDGVIVDKLI